MILAYRIPLLTDRMRTNTLGPTSGASWDMDWFVVADREWLEQRLAPLLRHLDHGTEEPRAA